VLLLLLLLVVLVRPVFWSLSGVVCMGLRCCNSHPT